MNIYKQSPKQGEFLPEMVAVEKATGNEFFVDIDKGEKKINGRYCIFIYAPFPFNIRCWVYKSGYTFKAVKKDYKLKNK